MATHCKRMTWAILRNKIIRDTSGYRSSNYTVYILHTCPAGSCIHRSTSSRVGSFIVPETN